MTSNTRIPKAELTGVYGAVMKRVGKKMFGQVPEPLEVMWHNKAVLRFYLGLGSKAQKWSASDESLKSFAHMAVASLVGCSWCLDLGYFQACNEGLDADKAREVPRWRESDVFSPLERDVMEYAEAMSHTPRGCDRGAVGPASRAARRSRDGRAHGVDRPGEPLHAH